MHAPAPTPSQPASALYSTAIQTLLSCRPALFIPPHRSFELLPVSELPALDCGLPESPEQPGQKTKQGLLLTAAMEAPSLARVAFQQEQGQAWLFIRLCMLEKRMLTM